MKILILLILLFSINTFASVPSLYNLSQSDTDGIAKEMAANFTHTMVSGASSLGTIFGAEGGMILGQTTTPKLDSVSTKISSSASVSSIPTFALVGAFSVPFGITGEVNFFPKITYNGFKVMNESLAVKWCFSCLISDRPFDLAIRLFAGTGELGYSSNVNNASTGNVNVYTTATWKNKTSGYNFVLSKKLLFLEPYVGFGEVHANTDIGVSAKSAVNIFSFTTSNSYSSSNSGTEMFAGINLNLFLFKLGGEYSKIMDVSKVVGKFSLYF